MSYSKFSYQQLHTYLELLDFADIKKIHKEVCKDISITRRHSGHILKKNILDNFKLLQHERARKIATLVFQEAECASNCKCVKHDCKKYDFLGFQRVVALHYHTVSKICLDHGLTFMKYVLLKYNDFNQAECLMAFFELICINTRKKIDQVDVQLCVPYVYPRAEQIINQNAELSFNDLSTQSSEQTDSLLQMIESKCTEKIIKLIEYIGKKCKQYYTNSDPFKQMTEEEIIMGIAYNCDYRRLRFFIKLLPCSLLKLVHIEFCQKIHLVHKFLEPMQKHIPDCYLFLKSYVRPLVVLAQQGIMTLVCAKYMIQMLLTNSTIPMQKMFDYIDCVIVDSWRRRNLKI